MDIYRWEFGDGAVSSVKDPAHLYSAPGTYTVNLKATNGGCSKSCTGSVVVTSDTGECWTDNSPVCNGTAVVFDAIAGMDSYKWRFGDGQSSSLEDTSHLYSAPGEYPVGLTMRIGNLYKTCGRSVAVKSCPTHLTVTTPITPMSDGSPIRFDSPSGKETYQEELGDGQAGSQENRIRIYPG
jgi:PKD repeat protein